MSTVVRPMTIAPDDVLVRARQGEPDAFRALVDAHHAELVRIAYVICGDLDVALDAVQAAWVKAWRQLPGLRDPDRFRSWLIAIAANEARQAARSGRRRALREIPMPDHEPAATAPAPDHLDLAGALARLAPDDRQLLAMRYLAGLGSDEIARVTGRSASGVRGRISRLVTSLRKELTDA